MQWNCTPSTPTFPGSSAAWKPGIRKEILSNQNADFDAEEISKGVLIAMK
jgi:hypothetical protein